MNSCPKCSLPMRPLQETCECGWTRPQKNVHEQRADHFRCQYRTGSERCPAPGTVCAATTPKAEKIWLCSAHWKTRFDPTGAQMVLKDYQRNGVPNVKSWIDVEIGRRKDLREVELSKAMVKVAEKYGVKA